MAAAVVRHQAALPASSALIAGAGHGAAARSKCVAASMTSAAERGTASKVRKDIPHTSSTQAPHKQPKMSVADSVFRTTLADSALSPSSFHHSGLASSLQSSCISMSKARAVACAQSSGALVASLRLGSAALPQGNAAWLPSCAKPLTFSLLQAEYNTSACLQRKMNHLKCQKRRVFLS